MDNEEYIAKSFQEWELKSLYNPSENSVAQCMNCTIQERICSMLSNANLPNGFWAKAVATAIHVINRSPNKKLDSKIIEEIWSRKPPLYKHLRVFGYEPYCHVPKHVQDKLEPK